LKPSRQSFSPKQKLRKSFDFERVKAKGCSHKTDAFFAQAHRNPSTTIPRLGIIATRRLGNAVTRNKIKRIVREVFRKNADKIIPEAEIIILPRKKMRNLEFSQIEKKFKESLEKLSLLS
jgi:ribonuclease P protein component